MPANLTISNFTFADTTWEPGETITVSFDLQNSGTTDLAGNSVTLSVRDSNGDRATTYGPIDTPIVPAGQTITVTDTIDIPARQMAAGSYTVEFRFSTYDSDQIDEFSAQVSFTTTGTPFFTVFDDWFNATASGTFDLLAGDDYFGHQNYGQSFDETVYGNDGVDTITFEGGDDVIYGGNGNDWITDTYRGGQNVLNQLYNENSNLPGSNELHGDAGDDYIISAGLSDTIFGGVGNDTLQLTQVGRDEAGVALTQAAVDQLSGSTIYGDDGDDIIYSRAENPDYVIGASIYGGSGDDTINSSNTADVIFGGGGADTINLNLAPATGLILARSQVAEGQGTVASGGAGADLISGSVLDDTIKGGSGADEINGGIGADNIRGGSGADMLNGQRGDDMIKGGGGADKINGNKGADHLIGGGGNDKINGGSGHDIISGSKGNDKLNGNKGDDEINGNKGADKINGGKGDDLLNGGKGADQLTGGAGADTFVFAAGDGDNVITDFEDGTDFIQINASTASQGNLIVADHTDGALVTFADVSILVRDVDYTDITLDDILF